MKRSRSILPTRNIFLDTNIFEENNFFHSTNIQSLFYYSKIGVIDLYLTAISKMELINRIYKRLGEAKEEHNKLVKLINKSNKGMIFRNLQRYDQLESSQISVKNSLVELKGKLDRIIDNSQIKIISANEVVIEDVFRAFYNNESPFNSNEAKKYEFPDAFIIETIDAWCKSNKKKIIVVTKDGDFNGYRSTRILFKHSLVDLLERISTFYEVKQETQIIPRVKEELLKNRQVLLDYIQEKLDTKVILETGYENIAEYSLSKPSYHSEKIIGIRLDYVEVTYMVEVKYSFIVMPSSNDIDKILFEDSLKPKKIVNSIIIPCDIEVGLRKRNDVKIKWINSNETYRINLSY